MHVIWFYSLGLCHFNSFPAKIISYRDQAVFTNNDFINKSLRTKFLLDF